jgi:hypothetical protein
MMDSLDSVEIVMVFEEVFDTEIPDDEAERGGSPSEIVDSLERRLSNRRPNKQAVAMLQKLAKQEHQPELAERNLAERTNCRHRPRGAPAVRPLRP